MNTLSAKKVFSRIGFAMLILFLVPELVYVLINGIVLAVAPQVAQASWYAAVLGTFPLYIVGVPLALLVFRTIPNREGGFEKKAKLSAGQMALLALVGYGMALLLSILSNLLSTVVAMLKGRDVVNTVSNVFSGGVLWLNFLILVIVAPIIEEIIFRGVLYKKLVPYGGKVYIFFSALFFALFHKNIYQLFFTFALGMLWAIITYYTGTIRYSIILHIVQNFFGGGLGLLLQAYGSETVLKVWGFISIALALAGLVVGIVWLVRRKKDIVFAPAAETLPAKHTYLLSLGMIFFWIVTTLLLVFTLLA